MTSFEKIFKTVTQELATQCKYITLLEKFRPLVNIELVMD